MEANLIELAKACPEAIISVKVGDLIEANEALVAKTKEQLEQIITDQSVETYPSREKVAELLDVDLSTLWRWAKRGLLVPVEVGGKRRYKMSDVRRMLNNGRAAL
ncbi:helix-turn-helix domain-containing protein [Alistipes sp.]|uniref:helix-turn-helix domain-containing protein n=1 Tax=Alistipes sp. TaxID=1872444 RepID=UPI000E8DC836|nr:helix-turn-helix domain-containing protein [Alistipes sp.]HBX89819.1 DNA-binding protein [Alistipes sp.]